MKIKTTLLGLMLVLFFAPMSYSQEMTAQDFLDEADGYINSKNYKEAVNSLNGAISELNKLLINEIREALPDEINGYKATSDDDDSSGSAAMALFGGGLTVERNYFKSEGNWDNYFKVSIMGNSPLLASVNMMLSNSMYMSGSGSKIIKMGSRKAILSDDGDGEFKFQLPLISSLISVEGHGFSSSDHFMSFINKIPFDAIAKKLGE